MKKNMKFEEALASLENIVKSLEAGTLTLDESLEVFGEAVMLVKLCNEKLSEAEQKVRLLTEGVDGETTDVPFNIENNEN